MNKNKLLTKRERKEEKREKELYEQRPLLNYSTAKLKAELRRRRKEGW